MSQESIVTENTSVFIAARIFEHMRPLIEAAIKLMPEDATERVLLKELERAKVHTLGVSAQTNEASMDEYPDLDSDIGTNEDRYLLSDTPLDQCEVKLRRRRMEMGMKRGRKPQRYLCDGEQKTLAQWAEETGLSYGTIIRRLREGVSLNAPKGRAGRRKKCLVSENKEPSESSAREELQDISAEIRRKAPRGRKAKHPPLTVLGTTKTVQEWAQESGLQASTILARLDRGWSAERAVTADPMMRGRRGARLQPALKNFISVKSENLPRPPKVILRKKTVPETAQLSCKN